MNSCRISLLDSYVGEGAVLSWLQKTLQANTQLLGATCHQRHNSRPIHRLHGRGNGVQDLWMVPGQRGWMVVYGQLFDFFCWICFVFGKWFWVCLWPIPFSCMPIPSHETVSILLYQQAFFVLWLKSIIASWCNGSFMRCTARYVCWWDEPTRALTSDSW